MSDYAFRNKEEATGILDNLGYIIDYGMCVGPKDIPPNYPRINSIIKDIAFLWENGNLDFAEATCQAVSEQQDKLKEGLDNYFNSPSNLLEVGDVLLFLQKTFVPPLLRRYFCMLVVLRLEVFGMQGT
jgi:hypothetical protein